ncbi:MAG: MFS transporter [Labilithrix sp.]|nr:MFS transporter [Labilithrix sp.]
MQKTSLAIASAGAFVAALSTSLVAVSAPVIARDLAATPADVSWVLSAYLLAVSSLLALAGKLADVLGRKRVYLTGFVFFVAGAAMCAAARDLFALVGARVLQGAGAAMLMAVGPAIVTRAVPPAARARSLGIQLAATYLGLTLGPSAGGLLAAEIGWHAVFVTIAGAGAIGLAVSIARLPADTPNDRASLGLGALDLPGAALFALGLSALLVALKRTHEDGWTGRPVLLVGALSLVTFAIFARHCALHASPLLPLGLFRKPAFAFGVLGATLLYAVTFMLAYLLPFQLQRHAGLSPAHAGLFMTAQPATMAVVAPLSGAIADRWGPRVPSAAGMLAIAGGMAAVASSSGAPDTRLVLSLALVGVGAGLFVAPNTALVMGAAPRERQATAAAMAATARNVGMALGIAVAASLDRSIGFRGALFVATGLGVLGALVGVVRPVAASGAA